MTFKHGGSCCPHGGRRDLIGWSPLLKGQLNREQGKSFFVVWVTLLGHVEQVEEIALGQVVVVDVVVGVLVVVIWEEVASNQNIRGGQILSGANYKTCSN